MHKLFHGHGGRSHTPSHINKPLPEPLVDPDEGKIPIGELIIVPIQGRDLPNRERFGKQDPFILFKLGNVSKRSSTDVRGGQRPRWKDDQINIKMYESDAKDATSLYVTCLDEDHQKNDFIGNCVINLAKVLDYGEHDDWFELTFKGREAGELQLQLTYFSFDPKHPTHRANRPSNPPPASNGAPPRRPLHPTNGPTNVEDSPSSSVSAATTPGSTTVANSTNPSFIHDTPMYRPPETTGPSLSVPVAGGLYPYGPGQQNVTISPLGNDGRASLLGHDGRVSPIGHDGRLSPSGQNGRISPSHQKHATGYPSPYHQHQMQHQMQQQHQMQAPAALYPPARSGYPPAGYSGYPPQQNQSVGYPPMQNTVNQGYPPIANAGFGHLPTGYPPSSFPSNMGYPPMPSGGHVGGLYPPVQRPIQMTNVPTGPSSMGYPPVGYPYGASNMYPPQAPQPQQLLPDNYKEEVRSAIKTNAASGSDRNVIDSTSGGDNGTPSRAPPNKTPVVGSSLPGAWPVEADNSDKNYDGRRDGLGGHKQSVRSSLEPPALPPRARSTSPPPALPPRNPQSGSSWR
ncbi:hypothetical protein BG015_005114 [Linnemannia schmuckeri]|uniref:C2 domain-containing protein n=1 Tax=Linnemannia schmuckeri TaxID=64567 RepID=A0A9P5R766_9FUNG|nr:hypothetical protein BG015_005114 [Linnemannia schmuckeri]